MGDQIFVRIILYVLSQPLYLYVCRYDCYESFVNEQFYHHESIHVFYVKDLINPLPNNQFSYTTKTGVISNPVHLIFTILPTYQSR